MRRILLNNIAAGMKLARPLYTADGTVLLNAGIDLNERFVSRLKEFDLSYIYIEDELTQDIDVQDVVSEKTRVEAVAAAKNIMENVRLGRGVDSEQAKKIANMLVDELCGKRGTMLNLIDMRTRSDYLFAHAVNVCVLSILTGLNMGYDEIRLRDLGIGALMHDIGKLQISSEICNKAENLTPKEETEFKRHPEIGFEILRKNQEFSILSAHCAFQHHEHYDGSGYPRGLRQEEIHQYAGIVAIADRYDALISDTPKHSAISVYEALAIITRAAGTYFAPEIVENFVKNIAVYPIGSMVRLSNNQVGVVVDFSRENKTKPVVRIITDENRQQINTLQEIDLSKNPALYIAGVEEE
ncbi:MAG: HD-GYP domain-containing protein [Pelosinus sp.]|nr:HD-GYP domain-containing protein [Pelosinus sp.]